MRTIYAADDSKLNLCDDCKNEYPGCNPDHYDFGDGNGKDNPNIFACSKFNPVDTIPFWKKKQIREVEIEESTNEDE